MELNEDTLSSMTDNLIEEKAVEQYVELGKLAVQLIPLFNVLQSDVDNQEDYYIQIGNLILEYYGENT